jgi:hypothetical protein
MDERISAAAWTADRARLAGVRAIHTAIFLGELGAILWLVASGWLRRRDRTVGAAAIAVAAEAAVFLANDGVCPLTPLAERLGAADGSVSDIFLPDPVARTIPIWSTALIGLAVALHARNALRRPASLRAEMEPEPARDPGDRADRR